MRFDESLNLMSAVIDSFIIFLNPLLILFYLAAALLIFQRKVAKGENGLYTAIIWTLLIIAGSGVLIEVSYFRNLLNLFDSPEQVFSVRLFRLGLLLAAFYNLYQYYNGMKND